MRLKLTSRRKTLYFILFPIVLLGLGAAVFVFINVTKPRPKPIRINDVSTVLASVQYCNSKNPSLSLNLYYPKGEITSKLPLVVYIHGGGWLRGDEDGPLLEVYGTKFIAKGIAVAAIDYRLDTRTALTDARTNRVNIIGIGPNRHFRS